jgi:transcriptional regulator with XRE-family HTH domain
LVRIPLKVAIVAKGYSQRELARDADISEQRISEIVRGWTNPTPAERDRLATLLRQPASVLFDDTAKVEIRSAV